MENIDARDQDDPLQVTEYAQEMYSVFREREEEEETQVRPTYLKNQPRINKQMRAILIDWLAKVVFKLNFGKDTLFLTVNILDRFLEKTEMKLRRPYLQLVGTVAFFIASKYEEVFAVGLSELVQLCDHAYCRQDILRMEVQILRTLGYRMTVATANTFLSHFLRANNADGVEIGAIANYVLTESLLSYELLRFRPSELAAASVMIARDAVGSDLWSDTLQHYTHYLASNITVVANAILKERARIPQHLKSVKAEYHILSSMVCKTSL